MPEEQFLAQTVYNSVGQKSHGGKDLGEKTTVRKYVVGREWRSIPKDPMSYPSAPCPAIVDSLAMQPATLNERARRGGHLTNDPISGRASLGRDFVGGSFEPSPFAPRGQR